MKKMDLKLVVTDDNDKDNTLSLFVPIQNGEDYVSSIELLNTVGEFISKYLPNDNKNILSTNNLLDYYIFKNKNDLNTKRKEVGTQKDMLNKKTSNFSRDSYFNYLQKEHGEEEIESSDITINIIKLTISDIDRKLINEFKKPINPLRYDFTINKSCKELVLENRCAAEKLELVNSVVREYIAINSGISELSKREMIENELHATIEDTIVLNNYVNRKYICNSESITPRRYTHRHEDKQKANNTKRRDETAIALKIKAEHMNTRGTEILIYKRSRDRLPSYTNNDLYIITQSEVAVVYKVIQVRDTATNYINMAHGLSWEEIFITDDAINSIKNKFNLSDKEFRAKIFSYSPGGEIQKVKNPILKDHQLEDIKEVLTTAKEVREIIARGDENE